MPFLGCQVRIDSACSRPNRNGFSRIDALLALDATSRELVLTITPEMLAVAFTEMSHQAGGDPVSTCSGAASRERSGQRQQFGDAVERRPGNGCSAGGLTMVQRLASLLRRAHPGQQHRDRRGIGFGDIGQIDDRRARCDSAASPASSSAAADAMTIGPATFSGSPATSIIASAPTVASPPCSWSRRIAIRPSMPPALTSWANELR